MSFYKKNNTFFMFYSEIHQIIVLNIKNELIENNYKENKLF